MGPSESGAARRAQRDRRGGGAKASVCERAKYPCQVARRTLGYTKVRYCDIAKKADTHPSETIQTQVATRVSCTPASKLIELNSLVQKDVLYEASLVRVGRWLRHRPDGAGLTAGAVRQECTQIG